MSLQKLDVFDRWFARKPRNTKNQLTVLIIGGVLLILLVTLISFALVLSDEPVDSDDFSFLELGTVSWIGYPFFSVSLLLGFTLGVYTKIMRLEYLASHIGEKRPSARMIEFTFKPSFSGTTLSRLCSVVFFMFAVRPFAHANSQGSVFVRDRSI